MKTVFLTTEINKSDENNLSFSEADNIVLL